MNIAYFAGGCFWCIAPIFRDLDGVTAVASGYCGGDEENPSYEDVKAQRTHHRETIRISYEPEKIPYERLLEVFLECVDPYDAGGQYIDRGESYTLAIYYNNEAERLTAQEQLRKLAADAGKTPAVSLEPYKKFWQAEAYHQDYDLKNPKAFEKELLESGRTVSCPLHFGKKRVK